MSSEEEHKEIAYVQIPKEKTRPQTTKELLNQKRPGKLPSPRKINKKEEKPKNFIEKLRVAETQVYIPRIIVHKNLNR